MAREEVVYEEIEVEVPDCFGFFDNMDPACRRCDLREYCVEEQDASRAECFGKLYSEEAPECSRCLDASQCANKQKGV